MPRGPKCKKTVTKADSLMRSAADRDSSSSQGSSTSSQNPDTDVEKLSVQRRRQMWEQATMQAFAEDELTLSALSAAQTRERLNSTENSEQEQIEANQLLDKTLQKIQQNATDTYTDLQRQLAEEKLQNEALRKEIERQDEQLRKEREGSEVLNRNLTMAQRKIVKLESELKTQRQTNMALQERWESASARSPSVQDRAGPDAHPETTARMQRAVDSYKQVWEELFAVVDMAKKNSPSLQGDILLNLDKATSQGTASDDTTKRPSVEDTAELKEQTNQSLESTIQDLQEDTVKEDAELLNQKEEEKRLNEQLRRATEESETTLNHEMMIAHKANEQLQTDCQLQRQNDLQRDADEAWGQTVQEEMEKLNRELTETNNDLQQQLSRANAAIVELTDQNQLCKVMILEEREEKERLEDDLAELIREKKRRRWWRFWRSN